MWVVTPVTNACERRTRRSIRDKFGVLKTVNPGSPSLSLGLAGTTPWLSARSLVRQRLIRAQTNASGEAELVSALVCPTVNSGTLVPLFYDRAAEATLDPDFPSRDLALGLDPARVVSSRCAA